MTGSQRVFTHLAEKMTRLLSVVQCTQTLIYVQKYLKALYEITFVRCV
jgi:hypothetical protein